MELGRLEKDDAQIAKGEDVQVTFPLKDFHHPYTPYPIQETFMRTVYQVLEESRVGILESPTGTVRHVTNH